MARIDIKGDIVVNEYGEFYEWFGWDYVTPKKVDEVLKNRMENEPVDVYINSGGGHVMAGQEIYSMIRACKDATIHIEGMACSAASVIACAGKSEISPVGMLMVHNVSGTAAGDFHAMKKAENELKQMNAALAQAYVEKSGMSMENAIKMMDAETWLTARQCVEMGLVDKIQEQSAEQMTASTGIRLTPEMLEKAKAGIKKKKEEKERAAKILEDIDSYGI